ncbi:MAG TPA: diacylglycerol kinase family protein [Candidatus Cybelea sp.]|nr:diacylglycerol kinase family protein [Candidatus Cybelea sp.]
MRVLLAVNPNSRRGRRLGGAVRDELRGRGIEFVERAGGEPIDAIVVAGGDGTFSRLIPLALELGVPMGLVPLGTFNDLARTLAIPEDVARAIDVIAGGATRRIDVATVNGQYYVNEASIGLSSRLARLQRTADKQRFGFAAIVIGALNGLRFLRPFEVEFAYEGGQERLRTVQLTVANSNRFGKVITVENAGIDDGRLDLYVVESGGLLPVRALRSFHSKAFAVATRRPRRITADGEPGGTTPALFRVIPGALRVYAPEKNLVEGG